MLIYLIIIRSHRITASQSHSPLLQEEEEEEEPGLLLERSE
jgi:hypothetical protein